MWSWIRSGLWGVWYNKLQFITRFEKQEKYTEHQLYLVHYVEAGPAWTRHFYVLLRLGPTGPSWSYRTRSLVHDPSGVWLQETLSSFSLTHCWFSIGIIVIQLQAPLYVWQQGSSGAGSDTKGHTRVNSPKKDNTDITLLTQIWCNLNHVRGASPAAGIVLNSAVQTFTSFVNHSHSTI